MSKFVFSIIFFSFLATISGATLAQSNDSVLVVTSDQVEKFWFPVMKAAPVYPKSSLHYSEQGCVAVGYIIEPDGTTSNHRAIASFPSNNFNKSSIDAAKQFVYKSSEQNRNRVAIFTTNSFTFSISNNKKQNEKMQTKLSEICTAAANKSLSTETSKAGAG